MVILYVLIVVLKLSACFHFVFSVPPLCGSIPPAPNYTPDPGDHVSLLNNITSARLYCPKDLFGLLQKVLKVKVLRGFFFM